MQVMINIGFLEPWITWVQRAVLSGTSQVIVNGLLGIKINIKRGVRQGDPISLLLFIIIMDFLARCFTKLTATWAIRLSFPDIKPCLLYADDALFFIKLEVQQLQALHIALTVFQKISSLETNPQKSELLTSDPQPQDTAPFLRSLVADKAPSPFHTPI